MRVGAIEIAPVLDGHQRARIEDVVLREEPAPWDCVHHPPGIDGRIRLDLGGYLIRTRGRIALVDLGFGPSETEFRSAGDFLESLRSLGVAPDEVDDIFISHLHRDHIGWASRDGVSLFPNATYHLHKADWELFVSGPGAIRGAQRLLLPVESQIEFIPAEQETIPGIISRPAPGHTPGSTVFLVADGKERALLLGDVTHTVVELTDPEWESMYDVDRKAATAMRNRLAVEAAANGYLVTAGHFPGLGFGRLVGQDDLRSWEFLP